MITKKLRGQLDLIKLEMQSMKPHIIYNKVSAAL